MLRPAHLLSTAILAAFAMPLLDAMPMFEQTSAISKPSPVTIHRTAVPARTISNTGPSQPVQTQRWVF